MKIFITVIIILAIIGGGAAYFFRDAEIPATSEVIQEQPTDTIEQEQVLPDELPVPAQIPDHFNGDSDLDGISDEEELLLGTNPNDADTDGDGLNDKDERDGFGTDPVSADTDGDGFMDGVEIINGYNPLGEGLLQQ